MQELLKGALIDLSSSTILEVLLQKQSYLYAKFPKRSFPKFKAVEASQCICDIDKKVFMLFLCQLSFRHSTKTTGYFPCVPYAWLVLMSPIMSKHNCK